MEEEVSKVWGGLVGFVCVQSLLGKYISDYPSMNFHYDYVVDYRGVILFCLWDKENHATGKKTQVTVRNIDKLVNSMVTET